LKLPFYDFQLFFVIYSIALTSFFLLKLLMVSFLINEQFLAYFLFELPRYLLFFSRC